MIIWFSIWDYFPLFINQIDRFDNKFMDLYKSNKTNAIELNIHNEELINYLINYDLELSQFEFISLHAPDLNFKNDDDARVLLSKLETITKKYKVSNIVFHPDKISNFDIFLEYPNLPISIENMDTQKKSWRTTEDIKKIFDKYNFWLTIDLQHCFENDNTWKLALDFQEIFKDKIVEYHISWWEEKFLHYPLFKTNQDSIIETLKYKNIPIIIESTFENIGDHTKELNYIIKKLED